MVPYPRMGHVPQDPKQMIDLGVTVFADDPPLRFVTTNLTAVAGGIRRTDDAADWERAIWHGVGPDGESLLGMPSVSFHRLSDADTEALVAYLQQIEPVDRRLPSTTVKPLGALLIGAGQIDPAKNVVSSVDLEPDSNRFELSLGEP